MCGAARDPTCPGSWLAEKELRLIHPGIIVHLEHDEKIEQDCFTAPVWATKTEHRKGVSGRFYPSDLDGWIDDRLADFITHCTGNVGAGVGVLFPSKWDHSALPGVNCDAVGCGVINMRLPGGAYMDEKSWKPLKKLHLNMCGM